MDLVSDKQAQIAEHDLAHHLGTKPYIARDNQGCLMVPGIRTTTHPEMFEIMATNYTYVAGAPGVAVSAQVQDSQREAVLYVAVVTINETEDYMAKAKELQAEAQGFDALESENQLWYDALYEKREGARILLGATDEERDASDNWMVRSAFTSWTSGHMDFCRP